ncbi:MAG: ABC transporter permease [Dethiobacteria bacterium]|jgi:ABC-type nitrate/sulfonate/bicarbonate transport system permease component|nr:ABC transporter permease [Bacillota bacterium]HOB29153.1 ABC transporter permease [Bacillota bacterium]HPZ41765.1 ABC transporter permease [Bacillota bacterium]HQD52591.1 ABC transporter permease [Bacillota bacterium]
MRKWPGLNRNLPALLFSAALIALWELTCRKLTLPEYLLPAPSQIILALKKNYHLLMKHASATLHAVFAGLLLAVAVAMLLAVAMDRSPPLKKVLYPLLVVSQAIPIFALAPVILIWLGVDLKPKIAVVALVCFFPLAVNIVEGLEQVNPEALELMQVMQAGPWFTFKAVRLPSVLPHFFSGLKISATYSVMGAVIGEWLGGSTGLGVYMTRMMHSYKSSYLFAAVIIVVLLSLILFKISELLAWLTMPWSREEHYQNNTRSE